ncbi:MAG: dolichyl-phosphate beta-glucosyltransferase [Nanoarchaeota archaeon]
MVGISVVVPAYNEQKRIGGTLKAVSSYLRKQGYDFEIIVVDDGSVDDTVAVVRAVADPNVRVVSYARNRGKGFAVRKGLLAAKYPVTLITDSDLATPIREIKDLWRFLPEHDIVIASRNMDGSRIHVRQPWYRRLVGKMFPLLVNILVLRGFKDTQCGFKLLKSRHAKRIARMLTLDRWAFDVELLFVARHLGFSVKEVPVEWFDRTGSKLHVVRDSVRMLGDLVRIRWNQVSGRYP